MQKSHRVTAGTIERRFAPAATVNWTDAGGELVIFDRVRGSYHALNGPASAIWRALGDGRSADAIVGLCPRCLMVGAMEPILTISLAVAAGAAAFQRPRELHAQESGAARRDAQALLYVNPVSGVDTGPGTKEGPLRTLAEAARRVNGGSGTGPLAIVLSEGVHAVNETTLLHPQARRVSAWRRRRVASCCRSMTRTARSSARRCCPSTKCCRRASKC